MIGLICITREMFINFLKKRIIIGYGLNRLAEVKLIYVLTNYLWNTINKYEIRLIDAYFKNISILDHIHIKRV